MCVDLGRRQAGVAEQALDEADVDTGLDKLCCGAVPEHVWGYPPRETGELAGATDASTNSFRRQGLAVTPE